MGFAETAALTMLTLTSTFLFPLDIMGIATTAILLRVEEMRQSLCHHFAVFGAHAFWFY